jgi:cobalt/nickel transport system ATP-binding protein
MSLLSGKGRIVKPERTGVVFQNPEDQLFMPTLLDDLMLPLRAKGSSDAEARSRALETLIQFELEPLAGRPASELSLGQRKRASLALAMVSKPDLLLLDEPTAELDPRSSRLLAESLASAPAARLVASHDLAFIQRACSRLIILDAGRIQADGPAASILADSQLLERHGLR